MQGSNFKDVGWTVCEVPKVEDDKEASKFKRFPHSFSPWFVFRLMIWAVVQNMEPSLHPGALSISVKNVSSTAPVMLGHCPTSLETFRAETSTKMLLLGLFSLWKQLIAELMGRITDSIKLDLMLLDQTRCTGRNWLYKWRPWGLLPALKLDASQELHWRRLNRWSRSIDLIQSRGIKRVSIALSSLWEVNFPRKRMVVHKGPCRFNTPIQITVVLLCVEWTCYVGRHPNITGDLNSPSGTSSFGNANGAQYSGRNRTCYDPRYAASNAAYPTVYFDASRSDPIYGNASSVQPPTLNALPCIKFWCLVLTGSKQAEPYQNHHKPYWTGSNQKKRLV